MESLDAILEQATARIGQWSTQKLGVASARLWEHFAASYEHYDARYFDAPVPEAPPLYVTSTVIWDPRAGAEDMRPDGSYKREGIPLPLEGHPLMGAGQDVEFIAPVVDGDVLTLRETIDSVERKTGKAGPFLLITTLRVYVNQEGDELIRSRESLIVK